MRHEFSMRCFTDIKLELVETHELECAVEIEPDEMTCCTSWYVARCFIYGAVAGGKPRWFALDESDPRFEAIKQYALTYQSDALAETWDEYLVEHPASRPTSDIEEHGTHWGRP